MNIKIEEYSYDDVHVHLVTTDNFFAQTKIYDRKQPEFIILNISLLIKVIKDSHLTDEKQFSNNKFAFVKALLADKILLNSI